MQDFDRPLSDQELDKLARYIDQVIPYQAAMSRHPTFGIERRAAARSRDRPQLSPIQNLISLFSAGPFTVPRTQIPCFKKQGISWQVTG